MYPHARTLARRAGALLLASLLAVACGDDAAKKKANDDGGSGGSGAAGGAQGVGGGGGSPDLSVCERWTADRADLSEGSWSGDLASCQPGDTDMLGRDNALKIVNLYRFLAGLPPVTHEAVRNEKAQACALMMHANDSLSHTPPMNWTCYLDEGAEAAGKSNIATAPGVYAVDLYMVDPGNDTTLGHRRWILSNSAGPIGLGSTSEFSCMWVLGGSNDVQQQYTAWPPPGNVPIGVIAPIGFSSVDEVGWSVQSDFIDLSNAEVTISDAGVDMPVSVTVLQGGYGSDWALSIIPQGWTSQAGHTYSVSVTGVATPIAYDVTFLDCAG